MPDDFKRYKTVHHTNHRDLDDAVTKSLQMGWQPYGSPYILDDSQGPIICQAMVSTIGPMGAMQAK
ncbi:MAG TPA: DUF1737 domain-containing protein [Candidatus Angelobacter sp.]|nr:DUF1737 domain-containing protein [Candidatus Angelobacter sp.]